MNDVIKFPIKPDKEHVVTVNGEEYYKYACSFTMCNKQFAFTIQANDPRQAEIMIEAIKKNGKVDGLVFKII